MFSQQGTASRCVARQGWHRSLVTRILGHWNSAPRLAPRGNRCSKRGGQRHRSSADMAERCFRQQVAPDYRTPVDRQAHTVPVAIDCHSIRPLLPQQTAIASGLGPGALHDQGAHAVERFPVGRSRHWSGTLVKKLMPQPPSPDPEEVRCSSAQDCAL